MLNKLDVAKGYKTYAGILIMVLGFTGATAWVSPEQIELGVKLSFELVGLLVAIFGNYMAHRRSA